MSVETPEPSIPSCLNRRPPPSMIRRLVFGLCSFPYRTTAHTPSPAGRTSCPSPTAPVYGIANVIQRVGSGDGQPPPSGILMHSLLSRLPHGARALPTESHLSGGHREEHAAAGGVGEQTVVRVDQLRLGQGSLATLADNRADGAHRARVHGDPSQELH